MILIQLLVQKVKKKNSLKLKFLTFLKVQKFELS